MRINLQTRGLVLDEHISSLSKKGQALAIRRLGANCIRQWVLLCFFPGVMSKTKSEQN
jgi:hypothetical protein